MIEPFLYTILPIYSSTDYQNFRKKWLYDDLCTAPLISPSNRFLPWQFVRASIPNVVVSIDLLDYEGNIIEDYLSYIPSGDLKITTANNKDYIYYMGNRDLTQELPCGCYYLDIYDGVNHYYTEVFKVIDCSFGKPFRVATGRGDVPIKTHISTNTATTDFIIPNVNIS